MSEFLDNQIQGTEEVEVQETTGQDEVEDQENSEPEETPSSEELSQAEKDFLEIQYNKEVVRLDKEKAKEYAQKGMNYDKIKQRLDSLESDPRLSFVDSMAKKYDMTTQEYLDAVADQQEAEAIEQLADEKGLPEDVARELYESKKFREQYLQTQQLQSEEQRQKKMLQDFIETYPDVKADQIPSDVWKIFEQGVDLVSAYARYENQNLRQQLNEISESKKINQENQMASTGSVKGQGSPQNLTFTKEQVRKMDADEVSKNYSQVIESMKHW